MKGLIERYLRSSARVFAHPNAVLEHLFACAGNGINLSLKGYIDDNYRSQEVYDFPEPAPLEWIYPWTDNSKNQPFRKYAGCRDVGFKESVNYFLMCVAITPNDVAGI